MAKNAIYTVKYRRKREGRTHYKNRLELLKSGRHRLVVRLSNTSVIVQIVEYFPDGDKVLAAFSSLQLSALGWDFSKKSLPACYLAGLQLGIQAKKKGITGAILDIGLQTPKAGSRIYAVLKGVVDAGVEIPCSEKIFPSEERITGKHIADAGDVAKNFTAYKKAKLDVTKIESIFSDIKKKILA